MNDENFVELKEQFTISKHKLFEMLKTPDYLEQWLSPDDGITLKVKEFDFQQGGQFRFHYLMPEGPDLEVKGEFIKIQEPELLSFTWMWLEPDIHANIPTIVTWCLEQIRDITELKIQHSQVPNVEFKNRHQLGWLGSLTRLSKLVVEV